MQRGERKLGTAVAVIIVCAGIALLGWGVSRGAAQEEESVGRYAVAAPDLILDTATGTLKTSSGQVLEQPIDASGEEVGRYSVAGYVTAVTRKVGLDIMNQPVAYPEMVKGYALLDTKTGQILKQRTYYSGPLRANDL